MIELFTAIKTRYDSPSGDTLRGLTKGLYYSSAPQETTYPHITFHLISDASYQSMMPITKFEPCIIQFSIWDTNTDATNVCNAARALRDLYDNCCVDPLITFKMVHCRRIFETLLDSTEKVWQYVLRYEILLQT